MKTKVLASCSLAAALASASFGQIVIDGVLDAGYGNPKAAQANDTGFGNATDGVTGYANGSELNGMWIKVDPVDGHLYLFFSGNLESNFNKVEIFIDGFAGEGQNALRGDNPDVDFNGLNAMGADDDNGILGLVFDEGFAPDFWMGTTLGGYDPNASPSGPTQYANIAQLLTGGQGVGAYIGNGAFSDAVAGSNLLVDQVYGIQTSINNSNVLGVGEGVTDGCGVTTGLEVKVPLFLFWDSTSEIKVCAFINGQGHDYASNQFLPALPAGSANPGGDGVGGYIGGNPAALRFDLNAFAGAQFVGADGPDACGGGGGGGCAGDLDASGTVDAGDIGSLLLLFGSSDAAGDLDGSGTVDAGDIGSLLLLFGACN
jgi:hypothetical protein